MSDDNDSKTFASRFQADLAAAFTVTFLSIPQGVAYALIAGLPPAVGLYAATIPAIVGSLTRSSKHVITGPTNALSLLVGGAVAGMSEDPVAVALTLALMIGLFQTGAALLRLGVLVDYISSPVVLGYITGAGVLIGVGQLPNLTQTPGVRGTLPARIYGWATAIDDPQYVAILTAVAVAAGILAMRKFTPKIPGAIVTLAVATAVSYFADFSALGITRVADLSQTPSGLPPFTIPNIDLANMRMLVPIAIAGTVLSLVESSSVARSISARTGQRLDLDREFLGQGLANIAAAFFSGYPTSGSLSRSALNHSAGAKSRWSGVMSGAMMLLVLIALGPVVDWTPVSALAGMLLVISRDLVNVPRIKRVMTSGFGDAAAFTATVIGTWMLELDQAIYLGVAISLFAFLRGARHLVVADLVLDSAGHMHEVPIRDDAQPTCPSIRILQVEGQLFFAAARELESAMVEATTKDEVKVLILRLKRTQGLDVTTSEVLTAMAARIKASGRELFLVGMRPRAMAILQSTGATEALGEDHLFPTQKAWFAAMDDALSAALEVVEDDHSCDTCDLRAYVDARQARHSSKGNSS